MRRGSAIWRPPRTHPPSAPSGLWPMVRRKAVSSATRLCGASGTRYVSLRGLIGSRPVPPT
eukprot:576939-Prymnesium_polylepis.1